MLTAASLVHFIGMIEVQDLMNIVAQTKKIEVERTYLYYGLLTLVAHRSNTIKKNPGTLII